MTQNFPTSTATTGRRRWLMPALTAGIVLLAVLEVWLLTLVGIHIGLGWTLMILVAEAVAGAWLMRREASRAGRAVAEALAAGTMPTGQFADAALILIGGVMLILPGFVTDVVGLICLLPWTRPMARHLLGLLLVKQLPSEQLGRSNFGGSGTVIPGETVESNEPEAPPQTGPIIEGPAPS